MLLTKVLGLLVLSALTAEAIPVPDVIPAVADEKTGPYRLTFFKSAIGDSNNKTVEVTKPLEATTTIKPNENEEEEEENEIKEEDDETRKGVVVPAAADESSATLSEDYPLIFEGDWSKKLSKIIDKESSSEDDDDSSSSSSSSEEDSSEEESNKKGEGSGDSSEEESSSEESEEEEGSEEEGEEGSEEEEEEEEKEGSEEEEGEEEEEEEEEEDEKEEGEEGEEEEEEEEGESEKSVNEESEKEEEVIEENNKEEEEKVLSPIKKPSAITPGGTQLMDSSDVFPEMQRLHKKFGFTTKGTQLLFTAGLYPFHNSIQPPSSSINNNLNDQPTPSHPDYHKRPSSIDKLYMDWLKSLPEMKNPNRIIHYPQQQQQQQQHLSTNDEKNAQTDADDAESSGMKTQLLTPGGTQLVSNWDDDVMTLNHFLYSPVQQPPQPPQPPPSPQSIEDNKTSAQRFFRSAAAFRTLSPQ